MYVLPHLLKTELQFVEVLSHLRFEGFCAFLLFWSLIDI